MIGINIRESKYDSGKEWQKAQESKAFYIFQTGLTGCVLLLNPVHPVILSRINKPQMNADECRYIHVTDFGARLDKSIHRKGREERKAQQQESFHSCMEKTPRRRTRMTRIGRIFTDDIIRAYPCHLCAPCSITFESFSSIPQQEAAL